MIVGRVVAVMKTKIGHSTGTFCAKRGFKTQCNDLKDHLLRLTPMQQP